MTFTGGGLRAFAVTAAFALSAAVASAQTPTQPSPHDHGRQPHAAPQVDVPARLALLDERIAMLTADMKMFAGEMKIQTMAALLEALVERTELADRAMRAMMHDRMRDRADDRMQDRLDDRMRDRMNDRSTPVPPVPPVEMEPEAMCSPFI
jgi:hypothetical protein